MAKRARGDRLRMDNDVLRYRVGYEGSVTACAALRAAPDCFLADTEGVKERVCNVGQSMKALG